MAVLFPARLPEDAVLDDYFRITGYLGSGGMAEVYEGIKTDTLMKIAIKVLRPADDPETQAAFSRRFMQEARAAASIRHPNVVTMLAFRDRMRLVLPEGGEGTFERPYLVMERLEGRDLEAELTRSGPIEPARALRLTLGCLDGLAAGHEAGVVHKDIKPSNLFLTDPGHRRRELLRVLDFGVARLVDASATRMTASGHLLMTPQYAAPEYLRDQTVTPALDVYQMALVLAELLTGTPVVDTDNQPMAIMGHLEGVQIPERLRHTPLAPVLTKALSLDHTARYPNAAAFGDALEQIGDFELPSMAPQVQKTPAKPPTEREPPKKRLKAKIPTVDQSVEARETPDPPLPPTLPPPADDRRWWVPWAVLGVVLLVVPLVLVGIGHLLQDEEGQDPREREPKPSASSRSAPTPQPQRRTSAPIPPVVKKPPAPVEVPPEPLALTVELSWSGIANFDLVLQEAPGDSDFPVIEPPRPVSTLTFNGKHSLKRLRLDPRTQYRVAVILRGTDEKKTADAKVRLVRHKDAETTLWTRTYQHTFEGRQFAWFPARIPVGLQSQTGPVQDGAVKTSISPGAKALLEKLGDGQSFNLSHEDINKPEVVDSLIELAGGERLPRQVTIAALNALSRLLSKWHEIETNSARFAALFETRVKDADHPIALASLSLLYVGLRGKPFKRTSAAFFSELKRRDHWPFKAAALYWMASCLFCDAIKGHADLVPQGLSLLKSSSEPWNLIGLNWLSKNGKTACKVIQESGGAKSAEVIVSKTMHSDARFRVGAFGVVGCLRSVAGMDERVSKAIARGLGDEVGNVRCAAALSAEWSGDPAWIHPLSALLADKEERPMSELRAEVLISDQERSFYLSHVRPSVTSAPLILTNLGQVRSCAAQAIYNLAAGLDEPWALREKDAGKIDSEKSAARDIARVQRWYRRYKRRIPK